MTGRYENHISNGPTISTMLIFYNVVVTWGGKELIVRHAIDCLDACMVAVKDRWNVRVMKDGREHCAKHRFAMNTVLSLTAPVE